MAGMPTRSDIVKELEKHREERDAFDKHIEELRLKELEEKGFKPFNESEMPQRGFHGDCDHPNTMENSTATIFWIVVMIAGAIFHARWLIWIVSTIIWLKFITRHKRK